MNKKILCGAKVTVPVVYLIFFAVSCKQNDSQIAKAVTTATKPIAPDVTASVQHGVVTLRGIVRGAATKYTLDSVVKRVEGVALVIDKTSFEPPLPPPPPPPPSSTPYPMVYPNKLVARTIDTAFKYNHINGVKVNVINSIVILTGNAAKKDLKTILLIANESHPKKVINRITVK